MSAIRPLPARFSLEFEKKEAKAFLRRLHDSDAEALVRLHATIGDPGRTPSDLQLADVQLMIAREYSFSSWPKLVRYFEEAQRQSYQIGTPQIRDMDQLHRRAQATLGALEHRSRSAARQFAAYVPRCYGAAFDDIWAAPATLDEARLAVARSQGYPSWEVMGEVFADFKARIDRREFSRADPFAIPGSARKGKLGAVLERYPDQLDEFLCGGMHMQPEDVQFLLDRGASPNHVMPTGIPVLEYALIRYWNGHAVDVLAARAKPRRGLWIAAGLGDVAGVASFLDKEGRPTKEAHALRPDLVAVSFPGVPPLPDANDEEILMEAFMVACFNGRARTIEYLSSRGFDVDCLLYGGPMLGMAAGNGWADTVESLLKCGANPDLVSTDPNGTPRDYARWMIKELPDDPIRQRIANLLGVSPER